MSTYYVYIHTRNDTGAVFYVGKGRDGRYIALDNRNRHWVNIVAKHGFTATILNHFEFEDDAFAMERYLIASYRSIGAAICNQTDGGEGLSGYTHTEQAKQVISEKMRVIKTGVPRPHGVIEKMAVANRTRTRSIEEVELRRTAMLGNINGRHLAGIPKSEATKEKMRLAWVKRRANRMG